MKKTVLFLLMGILFLISCKESARDYNTLNMVFVPASEKAEANTFQGLMDIVTKLTGVKFNFIKVTDYNAAVESLRTGKADIAWLGAATYVIATEIAEVEAFAAGIPKGQTDAGYYTIFVVKKDSPIRSLKDAKNTILALNHIGSTSGDYIPQNELRKAGLNIKDKTHFKNIYYAGSHDACLMSVANGQADICGMSNHNYEARIKDGTVNADSVRVIHTSPKIVPAPLVYSKKIPEEIRLKIKKAILEAHLHGQIGGWGGDIEKYIEVQDKDFDIMREVKKLLETKGK